MATSRMQTTKEEHISMKNALINATRKNNQNVLDHLRKTCNIFLNFLKQNTDIAKADNL